MGDAQTRVAITQSHAVECLMNAITFLTHPNQYISSCNLQARIHSHPLYERSCNLLDAWPSVSMGLTWVINRLTSAHCDRNGMNTTYDYIALGGNASATMFLRNIGLSIQYQRSDVIALTGRFLTHEVGPWDSGDRVCLVRYLKGNVFELLKVPEPSWSTLDQVFATLHMSNK